MQHDAPFVVRLVPEPAGDALDLLDHAVVALGPGVRDTELEEAFDLGPPLSRSPPRGGSIALVAVQGMPAVCSRHPLMPLTARSAGAAGEQKRRSGRQQPGIPLPAVRCSRAVTRLWISRPAGSGAQRRR